jgi:hypothetical protein
LRASIGRQSAAFGIEKSNEGVKLNDINKLNGMKFEIN